MKDSIIIFNYLEIPNMNECLLSLFLTVYYIFVVNQESSIDSHLLVPFLKFTKY